MSRRECHLIPENENKCIWMTSGMISYKLCQHDYRCETCLFDQGMRHVSAIGHSCEKTGFDREHPVADAPVGMRGSRFYHSGHSWAAVEDTENVRMGVNDVLTRLMSGVKAVVLPRAGEAIQRGECCGHIVLNRHIIPVIAPLNGTIRQTNARLQKESSILKSDPWDAGWMVTVRPENLEDDLRHLLFGKKALIWYRKKDRELTDVVTALLRQASGDIGPTMQDGGVPITSLAEWLNTEQYDQVLDALFRCDDRSAQKSSGDR